MPRIDADDIDRAVEAIDAAEAKIPDATRRAVEAEADAWPRALTANASTTAERRLIATGGRIDIEPTGLTLLAGLGPALSGGLGAGGRGAGAIEYGSTVRRVTAPRRRMKTGQPVTVTVGRGLRGRNAEGYVAGPAEKQVEPVLMDALQEGYYDAFDGGVFEVDGE